MNKKSKKKKSKSPNSQIAKSIPSTLPKDSDPSKTVTIREASIQTSGPLPAPFILEAYEKIQPGAADRIISMAEKEQTHAHDLEKVGLDATITEKRIGQICGLLIGFGALGYGSHTAINGAEIAGAFLGTGGVAGLVATFVYGRKNK